MCGNVVTHRSEEQAPKSSETPRPNHQKICTPTGIHEGDCRRVFTGLSLRDHLRRHSSDTGQGIGHNPLSGLGYADASGEDIAGSSGEYPRPHHLKLSTGMGCLSGGPIECQVRFIGSVDTDDDPPGVGFRTVGLSLTGNDE